MTRLAGLLLCVALARPAGGAAEAPGPVSAARRAAIGWYAFGAPFYLPETRVGLGVLGGLHFGLCPGCQTSSVHLEAAYTQNGQFALELSPRLFTSEAFTVAASFHYGLFPDRFYGIGPATPESAGEAFTPRYLDLVLTPEVYVVPGRLRVGPKLHLRHEQMVTREAGRALDSGAVEGSGGSDVAGLGASVTWDSRDAQFYPSRGSYLEAWYAVYPGVLGGHPGFGRAALDARHFVPAFDGHVLALNAHVEAAHGSPPFTLLPKLGGDRLLRGYLEGRYRDRLYYAVQAEYRFPIVWRLLGVAFAAVGDVARSVGGFGLDTIRPAGGGGLRLRLTDDGVNLRLDVAVGRDGPELYMIVLEAF